MKLFYGLFLISSILNAEPIITKKYKYYDIYPNTKYDIDNEMFKKSPIRENRKIFYGYTKWYIKWKYQWKKKNTICQIISAQVSLDIQYQMPNIPDDYDIDFETKYSFNNYYDALLKHEENHAKHGLFAAKEIEDILYSLGKFPNCNLLEKKANSIAKEIIKKYNIIDKNYDSETKHGLLEGITVKNFI